jgi:hypothetical protein
VGRKGWRKSSPGYIRDDQMHLWKNCRKCTSIIFVKTNAQLSP